MYTFGRLENVESLFGEIKVLEGAIACELNAQNVVASGVAADLQVDIDALKNEVAPKHVVITSKHCEREERAAVVCEEGRRRLEELRRKLADVKHELAVIHSPILDLPYEITAEVFNWCLLMGGKLNTMLLVCKRWTTVAYSSPRLWSRIAVTNFNPHKIILQGALQCNTVDYLSAILSRSQASPLQVELSLSGYSIVGLDMDSPQPSSLRYGRQAAANCNNATSLILNDKILRRCTYFALRCDKDSFDYAGLPMVVENMTILPLLSSLYIDGQLKESGFQFLRSLIKFSPSLRHIRWYNIHQCIGDLEVGVWTKRIESYGWLCPYKPCRLLDGSSSLRELGIDGCLAVGLTLPALQVLRWSLSTYSTLHLITAPHLHTLIITHRRVFFNERLSAGSITLPNLRVAIHAEISDIMTIHGFQTPALEHLSIQSAAQASMALFELFDGSAHMPTPKSLHLNCAFTDAALIAVLGRLPWLEELQVAGTIAQGAFWEALTPSSKPSWRVWLPMSYPDERANRILVPNLKVLLVNYSTGDLYTPPISQSMKNMMRKQRAEIVPVCGGEWTVIQASAVAVAREQAGSALKTLACWSPEKKVEVLIGNLDTVPQRPK